MLKLNLHQALKSYYHVILKIARRKYEVTNEIFHKA
ncbi:hypothetical protein RUMOBE_01477 [Blautia obeum ATCC 29174]|uniref:Uncharacterized protein n=1 Tax=Blautia obeum ATCC 29174 TaxID=411459 RepID=A5ZR50_9FIRM|nr:hypothetical protein RUMOBE_01477 [Blautia obeum ATCC 29174]